MKNIKDEYLDWLKKEDFITMPNFLTILITGVWIGFCYTIVRAVINFIF